MRFRVFLINVSLVLGVMSLSAQVQHSLSFDMSDLSFTNDTIGVTPYCKISCQGLYGGGEAGAPELPIKYITFSVPTLCHDITVSAVTSGMATTTLSFPVFPVQEPKSVNDTTDTYTLPDETIYNSNAFYPQNIASVVDEGYFDGNKHMVTVAVYPFQYNPMTGVLKSFSSINLTVNYSSGLGDNPALIPISRNWEAPEIISTVKSFVANPLQVEEFATLTGSIMPFSTSSVDGTLPGYEYCIITSRELAPAFKRLVHFKRQKGIDAGIVCMEDILESSLYQDGDLKSSINDDAGKLRQYLKDAWQYHNTKYVLLGGKPPHVPIRYGHTNRRVTDPDFIVPTDLYFSEFNGNWDEDNDGCYGESLKDGSGNSTTADNIDYCPDVYVGRLLCKNQEEVNNYIDKLLIYELNPGNGDYSYLNRALLTYSFSLRGLEKNSIDKLNQLFDCTILRQKYSYPKGSDVINTANSQQFGIFSFFGHGNPGSITLVDKNFTNPGAGSPDRYGIHPLVNQSDSCGIMPESNNGWDCLNNKYYPNIMYTISCTNIPFDIYSEIRINTNIDNTKDTTYRAYNIPMNLGESYTLGKDYGGVAYFSNTRVGWDSYSTNLQNEFMTLLKSGIINAGITCCTSKSTYHSLGVNAHHCKLTHNMLGDPEFMIWTDSIKIINNVSILRSANSISVSGSGLDSCVVAIYGTNGSVTKQVMTGNITTISNVSPNSSIMLYRKNTIPYIAPVEIQNDIISSSVSFITSTASLGKNVVNNRTAGDVVFENGADFTIYASDDVLIDKGVIIKPGATLTIESKGKVTIAGGTVENGGVLNIKAIECDISYDFNSKKGAIVNIQK